MCFILNLILIVKRNIWNALCVRFDKIWLKKLIFICIWTACYLYTETMFYSDIPKHVADTKTDILYGYGILAFDRQVAGSSPTDGGVYGVCNKERGYCNTRCKGSSTP